jgi:hypothetical protein
VITARAAQAVDPDAARREAQRILGDRRYRSDPAPRPFRAPLRWIGDRLHGVLDWLGRVFDHVPALLWLALGIAVVIAVLVRVVVVSRGRRVTGGARGTGGGFDGDAEHENADALERAADDAERDGDLERAVRLRFRAGLLRLGDRGTIQYRPSVTTSEVRNTLGSETFDDLAETFERVTYGGSPAARPDVDAARRDWPAVLEETKRR